MEKKLLEVKHGFEKVCLIRQYELNYKEKKFYLKLFDEDLNKIKKNNYEWESLIFADNLCTVASLQEQNSNNTLILCTHGFVKVHKNGENLSIDEIKHIALNGKIYDSDIEILDNNWFSLDFGINEGEYLNVLDDYVFEDTPKTEDELIKLLLDSFLDFFYNN